MTRTIGLQPSWGLRWRHRCWLVIPPLVRRPGCRWQTVWAASFSAILDWLIWRQRLDWSRSFCLALLTPLGMHPAVARLFGEGVTCRARPATGRPVPLRCLMPVWGMILMKLQGFLSCVLDPRLERFEMIRVAAIRLGRLGDLVMVLPALQWMSGFAELSVHLICADRYRELLARLLPAVQVHGASGSRELGSFDVVLDLHGVAASFRLGRSLQRSGHGFDLRVGKQTLARRGQLKGFLPWTRLAASLSAGLAGDAPLRTWPERHLLLTQRALSRLGLDPGDCPSVVPRASLSGAAHRRPGRLGLVLDAGHPSKRWPVERFVRLALHWHDLTGAEVVPFAGPDNGQLFEGFERLSFARPASPPDPLQLAQRLAGCDLVVAGDTGPLHVAGALGCRLVALFGPTSTETGFWVWQGQGVALAGSAACRPCSLHGAGGCPRWEQVCMQDISVEAVVEEVIGLTSPGRRSA